MGETVILVIGASSDIGGEIIRTVAEPGVTIIAHYNEGLAKIHRLQTEVGGQIIPVKADLADETEVLQLIQQVKATYPRLDKLVHLAAPRLVYTRFKDLDWNVFQHHIDIQLKSFVLILKEFLPVMATEKQGKIVLVLSSAVLGMPPKALTAYTSAKYAVLGLMKALVAEYADKQITINAVSPSMTETAFLQNVHAKLVALNAENHPLKRNALPSDIGPLVKFLLSPGSDYINGANIPITGGQY